MHYSAVYIPAIRRQGKRANQGRAASVDAVLPGYMELLVMPDMWCRYSDLQSAELTAAQYGFVTEGAGFVMSLSLVS